MEKEFKKFLLEAGPLITVPILQMRRLTLGIQVMVTQAVMTEVRLELKHPSSRYCVLIHLM